MQKQYKMLILLAVLLLATPWLQAGIEQEVFVFFLRIQCAAFLVLRFYP